MKWKEMCIRLERGATIDHDIQRQIEGDATKWRTILKHIVDGIMYLSRRNLVFREQREIER